MARILSIARAGGSAEDRVLVQIKGGHDNPLDLELTATEGSNPYYATLQDKDIQSTRSKKYKGERAEWAAVLSWKLLGVRPNQQFDEFARSVELAASVDEAKSIRLTFRQAVSGITQQLGSLSLDYSEEQEIALFDWTDTAVKAAAEAEAASEQLTKHLNAKDDAIRTLRNQLEDLIAAKDEFETQLLERAMRLINSKKLKIRDQQRLLATAKVDQAPVDRLSSARDSRAGKKSNRAKRKAVDPPQEDGDESSDGFESMNVFQPGGRHEPTDSDDQRDAQQTPEPSDQETDDESDDEMEAISHSQGEMEEEPPPRRALPFVPPASASTQKASATKSHDDEDTTDDEL